MRFWHGDLFVLTIGTDSCSQKRFRMQAKIIPGRKARVVQSCTRHSLFHLASRLLKNCASLRQSWTLCILELSRS